MPLLNMQPKCTTIDQALGYLLANEQDFIKIDRRLPRWVLPSCSHSLPRRPCSNSLARPHPPLCPTHSNDLHCPVTQWLCSMRAGSVPLQPPCGAATARSLGTQLAVTPKPAPAGPGLRRPVQPDLLAPPAPCHLCPRCPMPPRPPLRPLHLLLWRRPRLRWNL